VPKAAGEEKNKEKDENSNGKSPSAASDYPSPKPTSTATKFDLQICRFDASNLRLIERIEAPKFLRDKVIVTCQICCVDETKCVYLAASSPTQGFLYELSPDCKWSEIYISRGRSFADLQSFAVIGPITELLLVETNRNYVLLVSVYNSEVVGQRLIAVSERPDAIALDELGNFFVFDRATSRVGQHSRLHFEKVRDIALVERAHCRLSAFGGLLAVLSRNFKELKIYRY